MVSVPSTSTPSKPLPATRSIKARSYACDLLPAGTVRLIDGTPADAAVTITKGRQVCRYLVAVTGYTAAEGVLTRWQKPGGTLYNLSFCGFDGTCDCPACCWEATRRADRRHASRSGSYGCCKLDTLADLIVTKKLPDPRANPGADHAAHPGELSDGHRPGPTDDLPF